MAYGHAKYNATTLKILTQIWTVCQYPKYFQWINHYLYMFYIPNLIFRLVAAHRHSLPYGYFHMWIFALNNSCVYVLIGETLAVSAHTASQRDNNNKIYFVCKQLTRRTNQMLTGMKISNLCSNRLNCCWTVAQYYMCLLIWIYLCKCLMRNWCVRVCGVYMSALINRCWMFYTYAKWETLANIYCHRHSFSGYEYQSIFDSCWCVVYRFETHDLYFVSA